MSLWGTDTATPHTQVLHGGTDSFHKTTPRDCFTPFHCLKWSVSRKSIFPPINCSILLWLIRGVLCFISTVPVFSFFSSCDTAMLALLVIALLVPSQVFALEGCSSGDTKFMCENLNVCWTALGFASRDDLKYLCEIQGILCSFTSDNVDSSLYSNMLYPSLHILLIYNYIICDFCRIYLRWR